MRRTISANTTPLWHGISIPAEFEIVAEDIGRTVGEHMSIDPTPAEILQACVQIQAGWSLRIACGATGGLWFSVLTEGLWRFVRKTTTTGMAILFSEHFF